MKTHRCHESLIRNMSIRYERKYSFDKNSGYVWKLSQPRENDYFDIILEEKAQILYCPYCGEPLEKLEQFRKDK